MIAHWMSDPVHGTKAGYSKLAMKLAERVEADLVPKPHTKKTTRGSELLLLRRAVPAPATRVMFAAGVGWTPAARTARDHARISEGDGSPTSTVEAVAAAEVVAVAVAAAEAKEEVAPTTATTRASLLCVNSCLLYSFVVVFFFLI